MLSSKDASDTFGNVGLVLRDVFKSGLPVNTIFGICHRFVSFKRSCYKLTVTVSDGAPLLSTRQSSSSPSYAVFGVSCCTQTILYNHKLTVAVDDRFPPFRTRQGSSSPSDTIFRVTCLVRIHSNTYKLTITVSY